jgi:hypothetical protein
VDNELIFSKKQTHRFPMPGEVEARLSEGAGAQAP